MDEKQNLDACEETTNSNDQSTRNECGVSPLFELSDRLKALKENKKELETTLKNVNEKILEVEV